MLLKSKSINAEDLHIIVDNDTLNLTDYMTVLGINLDSKLNFNNQGISLGMRPANIIRRYIVTTSLIGWAHT